MPRKIHQTASLSLASLLAVLAASGCATSKPPERVVWPFPPETPRIEYIRSISTSKDVETGFRSFWSAVSGRRPISIPNPTAIALTPDEKRMYVTCSAAGLVLYFDLPKGAAGRAADVEGFSPVRPFGVAVDGAGNVYVSDQVKPRVLVYSPDGKFLREIGKGMFDRPSGLAFDRRRQLLYVVDGSNGSSTHHRVEVFAPDGRHLRTIGTRGSSPGEFNFPSYVTVAPDGKLYVADSLNFRIQVFDPDGNLLTMLGQIGEGPGLFSKVKGMAFDSFGDLYVVDGQTGIVQMFSPGLRPLMAFGGVARRNELFHSPTDIAIDSKNNIYVADFGYNHVNQYALINTTAAEVAAADSPDKGADTKSQRTPAAPASPAPAAPVTPPSAPPTPTPPAPATSTPPAPR